MFGEAEPDSILTKKQTISTQTSFINTTHEPSTSKSNDDNQICSTADASNFIEKMDSIIETSKDAMFHLKFGIENMLSQYSSNNESKENSLKLSPNSTNRTETDKQVDKNKKETKKPAPRKPQVVKKSSSLVRIKSSENSTTRLEKFRKTLSLQSSGTSINKTVKPQVLQNQNTFIKKKSDEIKSPLHNHKNSKIVNEINLQNTLTCTPTICTGTTKPIIDNNNINQPKGIDTNISFEVKSNSSNSISNEIQILDLNNAFLIQSPFNYITDTPPNSLKTPRDKLETVDEENSKVLIESQDSNLNLNDALEYVIETKNKLSVQTLPSLDIKRPLMTQKLPNVIISSNTYINPQQFPFDNIKYEEIIHNDPIKNNKPVINTTKENELLKETDIFMVEQSENGNKIINEILQDSNQHLNETAESAVTIREKLNLDIDNIPSIRTLKEIQNYLEQRCALIRTKLDEESNLKTGETISLRWKLSQPPRWQASTVLDENQITVKSNIDNKEKVIVLDKLNDMKLTDSDITAIKPYSSLSKPFSPIEKSDKIIEIFDIQDLIDVARNNDILNDKSTQYSLDSLSKETVNHEVVNKIIDTPATVSEITVESKSNVETISNINSKQMQEPALTEVNKKIVDTTINSNGVNKFKNSSKRVHFQIVTNHLSISPQENICNKLEIKEKDSLNLIKSEVTEKTETMVKENYVSPVFKSVGLNVTEKDLKQQIDYQDKCISCNLFGINEWVKTLSDKSKEQSQIPKENEIIQKQGMHKETKECCTQCSPALSEHIEDQKLHSPVYTKTDEVVKNQQLSPKCNLKNKRLLHRHKKCSTPVSSSSTCTTENDLEPISLSEGEVKLQCECSTSIGEIHLCRYANDIRKKVRILKQNPQKVMKQSIDSTDFYVKRQYKYYDNWVAYYVTKSGSSGERGTNSCLSSITSNNSETD